MGYWATGDHGGISGLFRSGSGRNPDGSEMLWGDAPADKLDAGVENLITSLYNELGRLPTSEELDEVRASDTPPPAIAEAIHGAIEVFTRDVGRPPTDREIHAGLNFADSRVALSCYSMHRV